MSDTSGDLSPSVFVVCENPLSLLHDPLVNLERVETLLTCVLGTFLATEIRQKQHSDLVKIFNQIDHPILKYFIEANCTDRATDSIPPVYFRASLLLVVVVCGRVWEWVSVSVFVTLCICLCLSVSGSNKGTSQENEVDRPMWAN